MKKSHPLCAVLVVAVLVMSACGARNVSDPPQAAGGGSSGEGGAVGPSDAGVTDDTIRLGASITLSGPTGFLGSEVVGAIEGYFEMINEAGGVNGRQLELITYDDRADASQLLANFRRLVEQDEVIALITGFADGAVDYLTEREIPTLVFGVSPKPFSSRYPTIYPVVGNALLWTQETIAGLEDQGILEDDMKVAVMYDNTFIDISSYVPFIEESWENAGAEVVTTDPYSLEAGSCDSLLAKVRELDVDWWDFQSVAFFLCVQAAERQGWKPNIGWGGWPASVPEIATIAGPSIDGVWGGSNGDQPTTGAPRELTAAHEEYVEAITNVAPELAVPSHLESPAMLGYWAGAKLLVAALEEQGEQITKEGLNEWIQGVEDFEVGVTPPIISMAPDCKTGSEQVWIGPWEFDEETQTASRTPATDYFSSPQKEEFGGTCFLTQISDDLE